MPLQYFICAMAVKFNYEEYEIRRQKMKIENFYAT